MSKKINSKKFEPEESFEEKEDGEFNDDDEESFEEALPIDDMENDLVISPLLG
jgi:hypothetical protein